MKSWKRSLFVLLTIAIGCTFCYSQQSKAKWVKFDGTASLSGDTYHLRATDGGEIDAPKDAVLVAGAKVKLKVGAVVKVTKQPEKNDASKKPSSVKGCRQTQCVGLVLICCDDGHVISACVGAWGCG